MGAKRNLIGQKFGRLTVIGDGVHENYRHKWECRCECGNIVLVDTSKLTTGHTQSCGCLQKERASKASLIHGKYKSRIHKEWRGILHRCKNPTASHYENYGGRGIRVCDEWKCENGFINFYNWSMENGYADNLTIDRKDNDKGYSPDNCRWVTHIENCHNRGARKDSKTGHPGVQIVTMRNGRIKYRVSITANYKRINLGNYNTLDESISVRKMAEEKYWGRKGDD